MMGGETGPSQRHNLEPGDETGCLPSNLGKSQGLGEPASLLPNGIMPHPRLSLPWGCGELTKDLGN